MSIYNLGRVLPIFTGEYDNNKTYNNLDVVLYNGSSYVAKNTTQGNLPTDENHWAIVALAGTISPEQVEEVEQQIIEYVQSQGYVIDSDYTHTDNNFTDAEKTKLDGLDLSTKQDTLESGINIKTINGNNILGSGNIEIEGVSDYEELTNKPSINGTTLEGNVNLATPQQLNTKQDTLVSGTNIKTINGNNILGSGNITIESEPAVNPFKGWFDNLTSLQTITPIIGDYAYVKGATTTDSIKIYECTTDGTWSDSGREFNSANDQSFATSQPLNEVHIKDENGDNVSGTADVLSAEAGIAIKNKTILGVQHISLNHDSPYFIEEVSNLMPLSTSYVFQQNQYTSNYRIDLFRVPAGNYMAKLNRSTSTLVYVGTVDSVDDVVPNGSVESSIIDNHSIVGEEVNFNFSEETILFLLRRRDYTYNQFAYIEENKEIELKSTVLQLQDDINDIKPVVNTLDSTVNVFMSDNETVWQLEHDLDWFTSSYYSYSKTAQYTKIFDEDITFSKVRINGISDVDADYRIYITNAGVGKTRQCPTGVLGNSSATYTLIKEGHITKSGLGFSDIDIQLDNIYTCPSGFQVAIYMVSRNSIRIRGVSNGSGNPELTSNVTLTCSGSDPFGTSTWAAGGVNSSNIGYFNVALTLIADSPFAKKDEITETVESIVSESLPTMIDSEIANNLDIVIPDTVYAIVGSELNIWNDTVSLSIDKGLNSPMNYQIRWNCNKGLITDRCFRFKPTASDVGNVSCTCYIYDVRGKFVSSKTFTIKVLANDALNSAKNIVYFGDSLGGSAATALYDNFHDSNRFGGTVPNMLGTKGTTKHYEAVGGYGWSSYATNGITGYRISVSGVSSMSVGAVYSDGSHNFEVYEVNITEGSGNCLLGKYYTNPGTLIMPSGTLTKVSGSGDSTIPYTDAFQESVNPLWNDTTSQLDINKYKQNLVTLGQLSSVDDKIDAVSFQFGINDNNLADNLTTLHTYISDLYDCFIGDNPNCKFIIGLTTSSGNDLNGSGANYGATWNYKSYLENTYKIRKYYLTLLSEFPNLRIATPNLYLDRYYGYGFGTRQISDRYTTTEQYHTNYVHPTTSGYNQMADAYLACYVGVLSE